MSLQPKSVCEATDKTVEARQEEVRKRRRMFRANRTSCIVFSVPVEITAPVLLIADKWILGGFFAFIGLAMLAGIFYNGGKLKKLEAQENEFHRENNREF
ncbi:MAG: hypothetical protein LBQ80_01650 [Clostridium sp.]|jgi:1,4-dihydroxy-2-naphthoate octaprenyltransferase|nr:hypothetical protein [Clostridium sp.]